VITPSPIDPASVTQSLTAGKAMEIERHVDRGQIKRASEEFEAYFISYLLKVMRETVPHGSITANKMGEMFHSFYDEALARRAAQAGGVGLSQYMLASLADQEPAHSPPSPEPSPGNL
jgi:peptidoglycan hydrolase FlgJ